MSKHRKVTIKNEHKIPIDYRALRKLVFYYYKGKNNIQVNFDNRMSCWGSQLYCSTTKTHFIAISPHWNTYHRLNAVSTYDWENLKKHDKLTELNKYDRTAKVIHTLLHELKHAMQCDTNPIRYAKCQDDEHPAMTNLCLRYEYSKLESEAEGWALLNLYKAIEQYEKWCDEGGSNT